ncbi:matrilin-2 isoform X5 [Physeter macrocephalus]|uniref:Matrilin-2 n=1 Tax=Physeter macrocephalus TaxID=9755 RepID=A0A455C699_PHYMC|nr:matrilin-2 isoform X5 [Physeter catodon]|eukprot:XP_028356597.1 matrilin-2 isoform X5 [Physeter catodon]
MEKMLVGCFLLILGQILLLPAEAREWPPSRSISRGRHARTHPQTALLESSCEDKRADVVFIIDSSRSVNTHDYAKVKEFIVDILQFLDIGPDVTRVGLLQYGSTVKNEFSLKTFKRKSEVEHAIKRMRHLSTGTMTGLAIQYALNIAFSEAEGARPLRENVPRVIMIVTDGRPQDSVAEVAAKARDTGILIFAIGVGQVDFNTLKAIGSEPHEDHVFLVANFSQIESLTSVFQNKLCTVHMCSILEHNCAHFCINTPGSYVCRCKQGYILNSDQTTCRIQDLCAAEDHGCEQLCVNLLGSFVCQCYSGYTLAEDGKRCVAVDYCASENHGCEHDCVNTDGSYFCRCPKGFALNPDKKTCTKIDYCASPNHGCQHECVNTDDSYSCRCLKGFTLNPDQKTCRRINYCALKRPGCEHECINTEEGYYCRCHRGYTLDPNGKTCSRADYCLLSDHGCEYSCVNTDRSFVCQCPEEHVLRSDGKTCASECSEVGRAGLGTSDQLDSCALGNHGCEHSCVSSGGSFVCQCFEGYILREDGKTCRRKDVCQAVDHGCEHICVNSDESYICKCLEGFRLAEDGKHCRRKDVCKSTYHGCEHICVNLGSSYICKCSEGFILAEDGRRCKRCTEGPVDLVFVIDGSKSLGEENFEIVKQFVTGIIDSLAISPKAARVGLLQYSTQVRTEFTLRNFSSAKDMKKAVAHMKYMGKGSMTGLALKHMFERSFTQVEGARPLSAQVPRVAIVLTDGRAQDDVSEWASKAQANGVTMYAVGVGKAIEEELQEIASEPTEEHLFYAEDFSTMGEISDKLRKGICEALEDSDGRRDSPAGELPKRAHQPTESEPVTINIQDILSCSNFAVQHRYLFEENNLARSTQKLFHSTKSSGSPLEEKHNQCKCENLIMFQNLANEEVRKLTQRLEEMTQRMEALENRLRYR